MHGSKNLKSIIHISSHPIIEDCQMMMFGIYRNLQGLSNDLSQSDNLYSQVDDFNWLKQTASPNWSLLSDAENENILTRVATNLKSSNDFSSWLDLTSTLTK